MKCNIPSIGALDVSLKCQSKIWGGVLLTGRDVSLTRGGCAATPLTQGGVSVVVTLLNNPIQLAVVTLGRYVKCFVTIMIKIQFLENRNALVAYAQG